VNTVAKRTANPNKEPRLAFQWKNIDWKKAERFVNKIQARIAKATTNGNTKLAKELQRMLRHSLPAKLMAVKKVTSKSSNFLLTLELFGTPC